MFGLNKSATYLKKLAQLLLCRKTETIAPWCRLGWLWLSNTTAEPFGRKQRAMPSGWWTNTPAYVRLSAAQICHVACTVKRIDVGLLLFQASKNSRHVPRGVRGVGGWCERTPLFCSTCTCQCIYARRECCATTYRSMQSEPPFPGGCVRP